jgi:TPR repeat protein
MQTRFVFLSAATLALCCVLSTPAAAQDKMHVAPEYGSDTGIGGLSNTNFNTPESDGRPGVYFFNLGAAAFRKGDYAHAIDMYKIAASWAYKPAEYNLGVMYFKGQGIPVDRPLGTAWMVLAAERKDTQYVKTQNLFASLLSDAQFERTNTLWRDLKQTYGDEVALRRAKAQWQWVKTHQTGTRTGGFSGPLAVGALDGGHTPSEHDKSGAPIRTNPIPSGIMHGGSIDGSVAYAQMRASEDPYDPIFLKNTTGTVVVNPLSPLDKDDKAKPTATAPVEH